VANKTPAARTLPKVKKGPARRTNAFKRGVLPNPAGGVPNPYDWVPNPNYPRDPRPFRPPPRPFDPSVFDPPLLYGINLAPTLFHAKLPFRPPSPPRGHRLVTQLNSDEDPEMPPLA